MTTEMLEAPMSAASAQRYATNEVVGALLPLVQDVAIPELLLEELSDIIADALVASIERNRALITADC